jgi:hypothetical protein
MILSLNLNEYLLLELRVKLTNAKEVGALMNDLLEIISIFSKVTTFTILEKQLENGRQVLPRTFVTPDDLPQQVESLPSVPVLKTSAYNSTGVLNSYKVAARANLFPNVSDLLYPANDPTRMDLAVAQEIERTF